MGTTGLWHTNDELRRRFEELGFITGSDVLTPLLRQVYKAAGVSDITVLLEEKRVPGSRCWPPPFTGSTRSAAHFRS